MYVLWLFLCMFYVVSVFVFLSFPCSRRKDRKSWKTQKMHMRQVRTGKIEHLALLSGIMLLFGCVSMFFSMSFAVFPFCKTKNGKLHKKRRK